MSSLPREPGASLSRLVAIMNRLLAPDGCPWDREQTLDSLKPFLIEETYEVIDAIEQGGAAHHCEELGDLLMQIVFQSALRQATGEFSIDDVVASISDKLVRRHPHVFADVSLDTADEVLAQWQQIKERERRDKGNGEGPARTLAGVPVGMPALARAQRLSERAAHVGFDWPDAAGARAKVDEELSELDAAIERGDRERIESEMGDVLFALVSLARKLGHDAESALRSTIARFNDRFEYVEDRLHESGRSPRDSNLDEMDALWEQAKRRP